MQINYQDGDATGAEYIEERLQEYNESMKRFQQDDHYKQHVVEAICKGEVVGGGIAYSSIYHTGYIDTVWVDEKYRNQAIGSTLLRQLEKKLMSDDCPLCHLETFDFQAPDFYLKNGYQVFGQLYN